MAKEKIDICEVCYYVDSNTQKKKVKYCNTCKAWICSECSGKYLKRGIAYINRFLSNL